MFAITTKFVQICNVCVTTDVWTLKHVCNYYGICNHSVNARQCMLYMYRDAPENKNGGSYYGEDSPGSSVLSASKPLPIVALTSISIANVATCPGTACCPCTIRCPTHPLFTLCNTTVNPKITFEALSPI